MTAAAIPPMLDDPYRRNSEHHHLRPWDLQTLMGTLGYTDELLYNQEMGGVTKRRASAFYPSKAIQVPLAAILGTDREASP